MKQTPRKYNKRNAILQCLKGTKSHPSAETVYKMLQADRSDISLATVYRNLTLFKQQGLIQSLGTVGGIERFDYNTLPHVHFICNCCQAIIDLPQMAVPEQMKSAAEAAIGGEVTQCQLSFTGICHACCQAKTGTENA